MTNNSPERERTLRLQERVFDFACGVLKCCPHRIYHVATRETWRQLSKAANSTSFNLEEADEASSVDDFIAKMKIALREAKESRRCMRVLFRCGFAGSAALPPFEDEARQIASIFAKIILNTKRRVAAERAAKRSRPPRSDLNAG